MKRREVLKLLGALGLSGTGIVNLPGCGFYAAESGDAFAPWEFPGDERAPERVVAKAALLASSPHNTQPWGLAIAPDAVELRARLDRHLGAMDSLRRELHIGLGCAIENMVVAARSVLGVPRVAYFPTVGDEVLVARVELTRQASAVDPLFGAIARRHTNRGAYANVPAPAGLEVALRALLDEPSLAVRWLGAPSERAQFRAETIAATEAIIEDAEMSADSNRWYRHSADDIERERDGTTLDATGNSAATRALGKSLGRPDSHTADAYWLDATKGRQTTGSAFVILSSGRDNTRLDQLRVGRIYQRMHLWATANGLGMQPLNQLAERADREQQAGLEPRFARVLEEWIGPERRAQMLFRVGYPWDDAFKSPRRPLAWVES